MFGNKYTHLFEHSWWPIQQLVEQEILLIFSEAAVLHYDEFMMLRAVSSNSSRVSLFICRTCCIIKRLPDSSLGRIV
jgi:hypothetical protein